MESSRLFGKVPGFVLNPGIDLAPSLLGFVDTVPGFPGFPGFLEKKYCVRARI